MRHLQQGSVLIVSLVLLLLMTIVGVTGMNLTSLEERMSGNFRDHEMAFQAAEAALVEGEIFIENTNLKLSDFYTNPACSGATCFNSDCSGGTVNGTDGGLCFTGTFGAKPGKSIVPAVDCVLDTSKPWESMTLWATPDQIVDATAITGISAQAKFIIEFRCFTVKDETNASPDPAEFTQWAPLFRITALAQGGTSDSRVMLQSTYKKMDF